MWEEAKGKEGRGVLWGGMVTAITPPGSEKRVVMAKYRSVLSPVEKKHTVTHQSELRTDKVARALDQSEPADPSKMGLSTAHQNTENVTSSIIGDLEVMTVAAYQRAISDHDCDSRFCASEVTELYLLPNL